MPKNRRRSTVADRMAYVLQMHGLEVRQAVVDYVCAQGCIAVDNVAVARIMVSDCLTGILDYGRDYSAVELKAGGAVLVSQAMLFDAVSHRFATKEAGFQIIGTTFSLADNEEANIQETQFPIEKCVANFLVARIPDNDASSAELLSLLQNLFDMHEIDSVWFWNSEVAPGTRATRILTASHDAKSFARFIECCNPRNRMTTRNQLIDLGWELVRNHEKWLLQNGVVIEALIARQQGLTQPLVEKLMDLIRRRQTH